MPFMGSAPPTTYIANNKQYIVVHATGRVGLELGNALIAFKLKE
jgi:glucose dehydrogenase